MKYSLLVSVYDELGKTTKRLEKTAILSSFLKRVHEDEIDHVVLLLQGRIFPQWSSKKIGVSSRLILKAISTATGSTVPSIEKKWKELGDLGDVASALISSKTQETLFKEPLTVGKVIKNIQKLAVTEGKGSVDFKVKIIAELLSSAGEREAVYIIRTVLEDLRVGVADGTLRDAIAWANFAHKMAFSYDQGKTEVSDRTAYNAYISAVQEAYDLSNDFTVVARKALAGIEGLRSISLKEGVPIKLMLAKKAKNIDDALATVGIPAELEYKYDGFRMQIHKDSKGNITIFTRRLEDVTNQFQEVRDLVRKNIKGSSFIIDCEAVGYDPASGSYLPFQSISHRIRRKYDISRLAAEFPVELNIFDCMSYEGRNLLKEQFSRRRDVLEDSVIQKPLKVCLAKKKIASNAEEVQAFYDESLSKGNEGIMVKNMTAPYKPGSRVGYMVKLKPVMETLELVIVAAEWGEGKRSAWLSSFTLACIDDQGNFLEIGKVGTGIKEKSEDSVTFSEMTELLAPLITREDGRSVRVKPKIIVEVNFEEIQKSPTYRSGYALRFPRVVRLREDRMPEDASSVELIDDLFFSQNK